MWLWAPPLTPNSVTDAWKTYSVILITPLLTEDNSCLMAELQWGVLTPIIWPKGLPELIITAADSALGLCTSQHITEPWLTGDSAYDRLGDAVLKWAADVVSLSCMCGQRTADRITCRSSIPRALKAFSHPTGDKCLSGFSLEHAPLHVNTDSAVPSKGEEDSLTCACE